MRHRHLEPGSGDSIAEVEDILERGDVADWRELAAKVRLNPWGKAARSVERAAATNHWYGTTFI